MKMKHHAVRGLGLAAGLLFALTPLAAQAAVTNAGTPVTNSVTLDFKVNSTQQTQKTATATFKVDNKALLTITADDTSEVTTNTQPGSTKAATKYTITNSGNGSVKAFLSAVGMGNGATDTNGGTTDLDMSSATSGVYTDSTCSTAYSTQTLAKGDTQVVYVCATIPQTATNGQIGVVGLKAQVGRTTDSSAPSSDDSALDKNTSTNLDKELFIFADSTTSNPVTGDSNTADDGTTSTTGGGYKVQAASLTLNKTVKVLKDPVCTAGEPACHPHAIPGATVEYSVTVQNAAGAQTATNVDIKDTLDSNTAYTKDGASSSMTVNGNACSSSVAVTGTPSGDAAGTANCSVSGQDLEFKGFSVEAGDTVTITYKATVN